MKQGLVTWVCKDSQLALSSYSGKIICAVSDM